VMKGKGREETDPWPGQHNRRQTHMASKFSHVLASLISRLKTNSSSIHPHF
jgi:hypothetical protein